MIPAEHVTNVCKPGQRDGTTCAYLTMGPGGVLCAKTMPEIRATIELRLAEGTMSAKGDNCEGWFGDGVAPADYPSNAIRSNSKTLADEVAEGRYDQPHP